MNPLTIKSQMIAVGGIAALLALYRGFGLISVILSICAVVVGALVGLVVRNHPPAAPWIFSVSTGIGVVPMALLCIYQYDYPVVALLYFSGVLSTGLAVGSGSVWMSSGRSDRRWLKGTHVVLGLIPLSMAITPWPLRLAFVLSRPSLERLANRLAAGGTLNGPEWAGVFRIVEVVREPSSGNVALLIDANDGFRAGFVQIQDDDKPFGPLAGLDENVVVGDRWRYQIED